MGSRRQVEEWIRAGRILVNGRPATIGQRIRTSDRIVLDGRDVTRRVGAAQRLRVVVYHKPGGELQRSRAGDDRSTVDARLPSLHSGRWLPINTLGFAEDGLLVLTNDGALAAAAGRRGRDLPVEYRVRVLYRNAVRRTVGGVSVLAGSVDAPPVTHVRLAGEARPERTRP